LHVEPLARLLITQQRDRIVSTLRRLENTADRREKSSRANELAATIEFTPPKLAAQFACLSCPVMAARPYLPPDRPNKPS